MGMEAANYTDTEKTMADTDGSSPPPAKILRLDTDATNTKISEDKKELPASIPLTDDQVAEVDLVDETKKCDTEGVVREVDVGITEYISKHDGFSGILKQRYSDFLVSEIDSSNSIVKITNTDKPTCDQVKLSGVKISVLDSDVITQLTELQDSTETSAKVNIPVGDDKVQRSQIHKAIRDHFVGLESKTEEKEGQKLISVVKQKKGGRSQSGSWPPDRSSYCHFVLYKENKDTMETANLLSNMLRVKPGLLSYTGTKDKRAKTCQHMAAFKISATRLYNLNKGLRGIVLGDFRYAKQPLQLGDHNGNHFTIVLRNMTGTEPQISEAMKSLCDIGFINYYGMQRFSTSNVPTHHIGKAILNNDWSTVVDLILKPRPSSDHLHDHLQDARQTWADTKDAHAALRKAGTRPCIERHMLNGLARTNKNDLAGAFSGIPRNTRLMYVHALQSYVWNSVVSRRIREHGLALLPGDLILEPTVALKEEMEDETTKKPKPVVLTEDNISEYSIYDLVMPLPGYAVMFPENHIAAWYSEFLKAEGLTMDHFQHKQKTYSLGGSYRAVVVRPKDVSWAVHNYDDVTVSLATSCLEELKGETLPEPTAEGKFRALKLSLSLPPSTYATMAVREVLKSDTSAAHQTSLNVS